MRMRIELLGEPEIELAPDTLGLNPKEVLPSFRRSESRTFRLGLVTPVLEDVALVREWLRRMGGLLVANEGNSKRFRNFPGTKTAFGCEFAVPDEFVRVLDATRYTLAVSQLSPHPTRDAFEELLALYSSAASSLFSDLRPDCVLVCFPEEIAALRVANPTLSYKERTILERLQDEEDSEQLSLFEPSEEEKNIAAELLPQAEELLYRNFHRALKAKCMCLPNPVPLQVMRRHTYVPAEASQSDATRAWNLGVALYYKTGNIPWRPHGLTKGACFVGVSFHHLKRRGGSLVYASVAQAFSSELEPFALRGASIAPEQIRDKRPYLTELQAADLMRQIILEYERRTGSAPASVVVHKTSRYQPEEDRGFRAGVLSRAAACHLVWFAPTGFRLLRHGVREPTRSTLCTIEDQSSYLFTTGYVPWWDEYPGPHIPAPLEVGISGDSSLTERCREILALTKMNWNSAEGIGRHPITILFARKVGVMMSEIPEDVEPNPLYRFYM
jgi:hypothetical protein